jgi:hypothetical protein
MFVWDQPPGGSERRKKKQKEERKKGKIKQFSLRRPYRVPGEALKGAHIPNIKNERKKEGKKGRVSPGGPQEGPRPAPKAKSLLQISYFK